MKTLQYTNRSVVNNYRRIRLVRTKEICICNNMYIVQQFCTTSYTPTIKCAQGTHTRAGQIPAFNIDWEIAPDGVRWSGGEVSVGIDA